jgi:hypothetical protein
MGAEAVTFQCNGVPQCFCGYTLWATPTNIGPCGWLEAFCCARIYPNPPVCPINPSMECDSGALGASTDSGVIDAPLDAPPTGDVSTDVSDVGTSDGLSGG